MPPQPGCGVSVLNNTLCRLRTPLLVPSHAYWAPWGNLCSPVLNLTACTTNWSLSSWSSLFRSGTVLSRLGRTVCTFLPLGRGPFQGRNTIFHLCMTTGSRTWRCLANVTWMDSHVHAPLQKLHPRLKRPVKRSPGDHERALPLWAPVHICLAPPTEAALRSSPCSGRALRNTCDWWTAEGSSTSHWQYLRGQQHSWCFRTNRKLA